MNISVRRFRGSDGERFAVLVDEQGMPLYYPTLFTTWALRAKSVAANSITNALNALKALIAWEAQLGINLERDFAQGKSLDENQIRHLSDFLQRSLNGDKRKSIVSIKRKPKIVSASVHYYRLCVAALYVEFLWHRVAPSAVGVNRINKMIAMIKANRPLRSNKSDPDRDEIHISSAVMKKLEDAVKPGSPNNPAVEYGLQLRNALMFSLLRLTGIRRGELLNLRVEDIDFGANTLAVVRRPDAKGDTRKHQPAVKTRPRRFYVDPAVVSQIKEYVLTQRNKLPYAKRHGYLFVTHKSGPAQGHPLSIAAFQKWMSKLSRVVEGAGFHAHALRHHWNYEFSRMADAKGMSDAKEQQARSYLCGWSPTSGTAVRYTRRHTKEQAWTLALELQKRYIQQPVEKL